MSIFKILFEDIIEPDEKNKDEVFGQWFSPKYRKIPTDEPDTEEEIELIDSLESFMIDNDDKKLQGKQQLVSDLLSQHKYKRIFDPGDAIVYRGIRLFQDEIKDFAETNISGDTARKALKQLFNKNNLKDYIEINTNGYIHPVGSKHFQSWTTSMSIAERFSSYRDDFAGLIFHAKTSENIFFGKPKELALAVDAIVSEEETISVGPVRFFKIEIRTEKL